MIDQESPMTRPRQFNVSVLVRTCGRSPVFLRRALNSIIGQTVLPEYIIVLNDESNPSAVESELAQINFVGLPLRHLSRNEGLQPHSNRSKALNRGIAEATTQWIAILDDDDTWAPNFLERVAGVLVTNEARSDFGGVITQTEAIYERVKGNEIIQTGSEPFNPQLRALDLAALTVETQFTINSMVISRRVFEAVGGYREDLPMQEDWEFNVRAATRFHFEVIPEPLVRYHQRPSDDSAANTSAKELDRVAIMIRNEWLRKDIAEGRLGLGQLSLAGESRGLGRELSRWIRWRKKIARWLGRSSR
jgi:glycosyltransferase involved in cell wall biosynthesis